MEPAILHFKLLKQLGVDHFVSTRLGGVSPAPFDSMNLGSATGDEPENLSENRLRLLRILGCERSRLIEGRQVHGNVVVRVSHSSGNWSPDRAQIPPPQCDALITNEDVGYIGVLTADCFPVLLCDTHTGAVGAVHAGWRGIACGVIGRTVAALRQEFGTMPHDLAAGIGPGIGACCYEVQDDMLETARRMGCDLRQHTAAHRSGNSRWMLDLRAAIVAELREAGVRLDWIEVMPLCTRCRMDLLYSYRGAEGGRTGRFFTGIRPGRVAGSIP